MFRLYGKIICKAVDVEAFYVTLIYVFAKEI